MNDRLKCLEDAALVTFLYGECEPAEKEVIAAHLARCARCSAELDGLAGTREHLAAWAPPEAPLGFRVGPDDADTVVDARGAFGAPAHQTARGAGGSPWWRQPLPAWAQAAAAVLVFVSGVAVGVSGSPGGGATASNEVQGLRQELTALAARLDGVARASGPATAGAFRRNLDAFESRLSNVELAVRTSADEDAIVRRVRAELEAPRDGRLVRAADAMPPQTDVNRVGGSSAASSALGRQTLGFAFVPAPARGNDPDLLRQMRAELAASEARIRQELRQEMAVRTVDMLLDIEGRRQSDREKLELVEQEQRDLVRVVLNRR